MIGPPQSIQHRGLAYRYTASIYKYIYKEDDKSSPVNRG